MDKFIVSFWINENEQHHIRIEINDKCKSVDDLYMKVYKDEVLQKDYIDNFKIIEEAE